MGSSLMATSAIVPYLCASNAEAAVTFYRTVFGAVETDRYQDTPGAPIGHVTLEIYGSSLFLSDEFPEIGVISPTTLGGTPMAVHVTVPDVDSVTQLALKEGATLLREPADQGNGHRNAKFRDPFGHVWMVSAPIGG